MKPIKMRQNTLMNPRGTKVATVNCRGGLLHPVRCFNSFWFLRMIALDLWYCFLSLPVNHTHTTHTHSPISLNVHFLDCGVIQSTQKNPAENMQAPHKKNHWAHWEMNHLVAHTCFPFSHYLLWKYWRRAFLALTSFIHHEDERRQSHSSLLSCLHVAISLVSHEERSHGGLFTAFPSETLRSTHVISHSRRWL